MSDVCKHVLTFMTNVFPRFFIQSAVVQYVLNKNATLLLFLWMPFLRSNE